MPAPSDIAHAAPVETRRAIVTQLAVLIVLTMLAYLPLHQAGFLWDDDVLVTQNLQLRSVEGLRDIWLGRGTDDYFPLTLSTFWLDRQAWSFLRDTPHEALGYHLTNLILHTLGCVLLWRLLLHVNSALFARPIVLGITPALLAAILFAVHPLNVATVAWIAERKNVLSLIFFLLTIHCYFRFDHGGAHARSRWNWYAVSLLMFLCALLAKTSVVMLPVALLALQWWRHGRLRARDMLPLAPLFIMSFALGLVTIAFQHADAVNTTKMIEHPPWPARIAVSGWAVWFYFIKSFWPAPLMMIYPKWQPDTSQLIAFIPAGSLLVILAVLLALRSRPAVKALLVAIVYFIAMLLPVLGLVPMAFNQYAHVADHFAHLPLIAPMCVLAVVSCAMLRRSSGVMRRLLALAIAGIIVGFIALSFHQSIVRQNLVNLFEHNLRHHANLPIAHHMIGVELERRGLIDQALASQHRAVSLDPAFVGAHVRIGNIHMQRGQIAIAAEYYERGLAHSPRQFLAARRNYAVALAQLGRLDDAEKHLRIAIEHDPSHAGTHENLGNVLRILGRTDEAIVHYRHAVEHNPASSHARDSLVQLLRQTGRLDEAAHYQRP